MRIAYVIYNERPVSGLIRTQVVSLLKEIKKQSVNLEIVLVAFWQPWVAWKFKGEIDKMRSDLAASGIAQEDYPLAIVPSRYFLYNARLLPVLRTWASYIFRSVIRKRFDAVHCRGYFPSYLAARLKDELGYRLIFDMRSLWPKEYIAGGVWTIRDHIYNVWEKIENYTLANCDAAIGVSEGMVEEIHRVAPEANATLIPICVDTRDFNYAESARGTLREELGWENHRVIAYQGSLGIRNSNICETVACFKSIIKEFEDVRLLILTAAQAVDIDRIMGDYGIRYSQYAIRHPKQSEVSKWLSAADVGIHAMLQGPDSHTRLGVKVVEYLSCGLPIIVNPNVGAAAKLATRFGVGIVLEPRNNDAFRQKTEVEWLFSKSSILRERCRRVAVDLFSVESCAAKYVELYDRLFIGWSKRWT